MHLTISYLYFDNHFVTQTGRMTIKKIDKTQSRGVRKCSARRSPSALNTRLRTQLSPKLIPLTHYNRQSSGLK